MNDRNRCLRFLLALLPFCGLLCAQDPVYLVDEYNDNVIVLDP